MGFPDKIVSSDDGIPGNVNSSAMWFFPTMWLPPTKESPGNEFPGRTGTNKSKFNNGLLNQ